MAESAVFKALSRASRAAEARSLPAAEARIVIFSDLHKGVRDGVDDFLRCEPADARTPEPVTGEETPA